MKNKINLYKIRYVNNDGEDANGDAVLYTDHQAAMSELQKENERLATNLIETQVEHPCYQLSKELEAENKDLRVLANQKNTLSEVYYRKREELRCHVFELQDKLDKAIKSLGKACDLLPVPEHMQDETWYEKEKEVHQALAELTKEQS